METKNKIAVGGFDKKKANIWGGQVKKKCWTDVHEIFHSPPSPISNGIAHINESLLSGLSATFGVGGALARVGGEID